MSDSGINGSGDNPSNNSRNNNADDSCKSDHNNVHDDDDDGGGDGTETCGSVFLFIYLFLLTGLRSSA